MSPNNGPSRDNAFSGYEGPGYSEEFWILDVEGTRLMIAAGRSPGARSEDLAEAGHPRLHPNRAMRLLQTVRVVTWANQVVPVSRAGTDPDGGTGGTPRR